MRFTKTELLAAFQREDKSYRLGMMCTHWIRDIERYTPNAADLAATLHMQAGGRWVSNNDLATLLADPMKRELLSSEFLLTYLHTLIRAPFELLSDYCEDYDKAVSAGFLLNDLKSSHGTAWPIRILKLARAAMIHLCLAMHREENFRSKDKSLAIPMTLPTWKRRRRY